MSDDMMPEQAEFIEASFSSAIYPLAIVKKASYRLLGEGAVEISERDGVIGCRICFGRPLALHEAMEIRQRLLKEVLDQDLRQIVAAETESTRNAILGYAFSRTSLIQK